MAASSSSSSRNVLFRTVESRPGWFLSFVFFVCPLAGGFFVFFVYKELGGKIVVSRTDTCDPEGMNPMEARARPAGSGSVQHAVEFSLTFLGVCLFPGQVSPGSGSVRHAVYFSLTFLGVCLFPGQVLPASQTSTRWRPHLETEVGWKRLPSFLLTSSCCHPSFFLFVVGQVASSSSSSTRNVVRNYGGQRAAVLVGKSRFFS